MDVTFRLTCPICGPRDVYEFRCGGPERGPAPEGSPEEYLRWAQFRLTPPAPREEWWYHASGCGVWFTTWRNPATNREEPPPGRSEAPGDG